MPVTVEVTGRLREARRLKAIHEVILTLCGSVSIVLQQISRKLGLQQDRIQNTCTPKLHLATIAEGLDSSDAHG